ncbi:MAG: IPT/TIG domain-containing protein [Chryseolinea sp.]
MTKVIRPLRTFIKLLLMFSLIDVSCNNDNDNLPATEIITMSPDRGPKFTRVTIAGSGFGVDTAAVSVTVNGKPAKVVSVTNSKISFMIPDKAGSGKVVLKVKGETIDNQSFFTYLKSASTLVGDGVSDNLDGALTIAELNGPTGIFIDPDKGIYLTEYDFNSIRLITPDSNITTLTGKYTYGFRDGAIDIAAFNGPNGITKDKSGNLYVADQNNHVIRKIDTQGNVTTLAGSPAVSGAVNGMGSAARFNQPKDIAIDKDGNLIVVDAINNLIRKVTPGGLVSTLAGSGEGAFADGVGIAAKFNAPSGCAVDDDGNVYVADKLNQRVRKISPDGVVTTLAGNGVVGFADGDARVAMFNAPFGLVVAPDGIVYVVDADNHAIRTVDQTGYVTTLSGRSSGYLNGLLEDALFKMPVDIDVAADGTIYVVDYGDSRIRKID